MEDLIQEYKQGRTELRGQVKAIKIQIKATDDISDQLDLKHDLSLINSMIRDMTEAISLMKNPMYRLRGSNKDPNKTESKIIFMDPAHLNLLNIPEESWEPDQEDEVRAKIKRELTLVLEKNMNLLTSKQMSTIHRWINLEKSISEIAREDQVSRQSVWERIFGNRTHQGALRKLKTGK